MRTDFITLVLIITLSYGFAAADDSAKDKPEKEKNTSIVIDVTANQGSYSSSWDGGEAGSVNWSSNLVGLTKQKLSDKLSLSTTLKLSFGQSFSQDEETLVWDKPKKTVDLIDLENVGRLAADGGFNPYLALRIETQFADTKNPNKRFVLSPMRITESAGLSRQLYKKKEDVIKSRLGLGVRQLLRKTITDSTITDGVTNYTVEDSNSVDGGLEMVTDIRLTLAKNLVYLGKLSLFKTLMFSKKDELKGTVAENDWKAIDVNWENTFNAKINNLITVNLNMQLLYDKQIVDKGRFKQTLALGLSYTLY